jgi:SET domain-containing protein
MRVRQKNQLWVDLDATCYAFLNHSVPGNCEFEEFDLYALKNIKKDEELTFDYQESEFD